MTILSSETIHASCVAIGGRGVLLAGRSGTGKSDLALRLIDRGAILVSDDYTCLTRRGEQLHAAPPAMAGRIEARGVGIVPVPHVADVPVALLLDLEAPVSRFPEAMVRRRLAGIDIPVAPLAPLEASAPIKVELLLAQVTG